MFRFFKNKDRANELSNTPIHKKLEKNCDLMKTLFSAGVNSDFSYRELTARYSNKEMTIFYYATIVNSVKIHDAIIRPLLENIGSDIKNVITLESIDEVENFEDVVEHVNSGKAIIFEEGNTTAYSIDVAEFQHRGIEKSENESIIKGPKEAFTESLNTNVSLLRKRFHDKQLINETIKIGKRSKMEVNLLYIADVVNEDVLKNMKERVKNIDADNVRNIEILEQYIEERPYSIVPSTLYTERPDRSASYIEDGHIALLMDNSSAALIAPVTFWQFFHTPEDRYLRFLFGNFTRIIRFIAFFITLFVSAIYVGISNFHSQMIPPDLLLAITSARERVPFPLILEVLIMEFAFELIREAGIRIPTPLGPTIGIVGALILGQAAVEANIISPIVVIIVALSGLTSFAVVDISMNYSVRISRFIFIISAGWFGMFSLTGAFILWLIYLSSVRSFGVPFFSPLSPGFKSPGNNLFRKIAKNEVWRSGNVYPKDVKKKQSN